MNIKISARQIWRYHEWIEELADQLNKGKTVYVPVLTANRLKDIITLIQRIDPTLEVEWCPRLTDKPFRKPEHGYSLWAVPNEKTFNHLFE